MLLISHFLYEATSCFSYEYDDSHLFYVCIKIPKRKIDCCQSEQQKSLRELFVAVSVQLCTVGVFVGVWVPSSRCFAERDWEQESTPPSVNEVFDAYRKVDSCL